LGAVAIERTLPKPSPAKECPQHLRFGLDFKPHQSVSALQEERRLTSAIRSAAAETMNVLVDRLEEAELLAIKAIPKAPVAARKHVTQLQAALSDAAVLAAAIAIIMKGEIEIAS
jgi:hypothetical protein